MNKKAYEEWLLKKESSREEKNTSINTSNNEFVPFYPSSRTISFGR